MNHNPFNHSHFIGYINQVTPQYVKIHFPSSVLMKSFSFYGEDLKGGLVGNFVIIEGENYGFLGKILELSLPEKERLELSEKSFNTRDFHPTGKIEILLSFDLFNPEKVEKGLNSLPLIGSKVFISSSEFIKGYFKNFGVKKEHINNSPIINFGRLTHDKKTVIELSQQAIFGRHCAVIGTTGGGKSYTVSKLIEGIIKNKNKAIIIDPTGEYSTYDEISQVEKSTLISDSYFSYKNLTINDLFVLFRPSGQVQQPVLLEAIKSLKIAKCLINDQARHKVISESNGEIIIEIKGIPLTIKDGCIVKLNMPKAPILNMNFLYKKEVENTDISDFDISLLTKQIYNECVYDNGNNWGAHDARNWGNSTSLVMRINNILNDSDYKKMFGFESNEEEDLISVLNKFLKDKKNLLRIGFENVPYNFQVREILANAIGKYLLSSSRKGTFKNSPIVLFIDEAHQFLNKKVKDEYFETTELNSFDTIAKESRKYGLFLCIATQMPRDIPIGTLSQIGTFISHRLINHFDKEAIANACSSANRDTLAFLPVLGAGESILMGVDFPMPVMLKVDLPEIEPNSKTPLFNIT